MSNEPRDFPDDVFLSGDCGKAPAAKLLGYGATFDPIMCIWCNKVEVGIGGPWCSAECHQAASDDAIVTSVLRSPRFREELWKLMAEKMSR